MRAVWMQARAELRLGWRALVSLALLAGLVGGSALAAFAGARRTETAYPRFVRAQEGFHALTGGGADENFEARYAELRAHPAIADQVELIAAGTEVTVPARADKPERTFTLPEIMIMAEPSGRAYYEINRAKILAGRMPDLRAVDEVLVPFPFAERAGISVGDQITIGVGFDEGFQPAERVPVRVVGIAAVPGEFDAVGQAAFLSVYLPPAGYERWRHVMPPRNSETWSLAVRLRGGSAAAAEFQRDVQSRLLFDVPLIEPVVTAGVQKSMRLYAMALWLLGALVAAATLAVVGQTLSRQILLDSERYPTLRALGTTRAQLSTLGLVRAATVALLAAPVAIGTAAALSPLMPIGAARAAEPDPGMAFDALTLLGGATAMAVILVAMAVIPAVRASRIASRSQVDAGGRGTASAAVSFVARAGSASVATGVRMALHQGRGRTAVPVRSTILAVAIGIAAVTASVVSAQSLAYLIETPELAGFTYDAIVPHGRDGGGDEEERLRAVPSVAGVTRGTGLNVEIGDVPMFAVAFEQDAPIGFAMIDGEAPTDQVRAVRAGGPEIPEIALGRGTMRRLGIARGDVVDVSYEGQSRESGTFRAVVTGVAAVPALPWGAVEPGEGAVMTLDALRSVTSSSEGGCCFVAFRSGVDLGAARAELADHGFEAFLRTERADLVTLQRITGLPVVLAGVFAVIALATLAHVLSSAIRRRRRDLAILKAIGFIGGQLRATIAWQASTIAVLCVALGLPIGIIAGRWGWDVVAGQFGVVSVRVVPVWTLLVSIPTAIVLANLIAVLPARYAARTNVAVVLRAE